LRHRSWDQQLRRKRPLRLLNTSGGKAVYENTVADRIIEDSVKLCQVGIEHMRCGAFEEELC
jgi:hypothetical protein